MSNSNYKQVFWLIDAGTGDIGAQARAQLAKAALALNSHQAVVLAISSGGYTADTPPQIALTVAIDYDEAILTPAVESAHAAEGLAVKATLQSDIHYYELGSVELSNIAEATKVVDLAAARQAIDELYTLPISAEHGNVTDEGPTPIEAFSISEGRMNALRNARDEAVEGQIRYLRIALRKVCDAWSIPSAIQRMMSSDIVTVGSDMFRLYTGYIRSLSPLEVVLKLVLEDLGLPRLQAAAGRIVGILNVVLDKRPVSNVLLLVNGQKSAGIRRVTDYCPHAVDQCAAFVPFIQSAYIPRFPMPASRKAFPCGLYLYHMMKGPLNAHLTEATDAVSMGIEFNVSGKMFCVGMFSPDNSMGKRENSIRVTSENALSAEAQAAHSETVWEDLNVDPLSCAVSRAGRGTVNYGICYLE